MFPAARFIHVVRDPRAVALSWAKTNWGPNTFWHVARVWSYHVGIAMADMERLEPSRRLTIRFEDVVREPEHTLRDVCKFLDLDWEPEMLKAQKRGKVELPSRQDESLHQKTGKELDPERAEPWCRVEPKKLRHVEAVCWDLMDKYDYEHTSDRPFPPTPREEFQYKVVNRLLSYWNVVRRRVDGIRPPKYPIYH
jgi:hypothetical protein